MKKYDTSKAIFKINIPWEKFDILKSKDLISFNCINCHTISYKTKKSINQCLRNNIKNLFCCRRCVIDYSKRDIPSRDELYTLIKANYSLSDIGEYYHQSSATVAYWVKNHNLKTNFTFGIKDTITKAKQLEKRIQFYKEHPDKKIGNSSGISIHCERIKEELRNKDIEFQEEVELLRHVDKFYRADIVFEKYGCVIEINGKQHYNKNGKLTNYYQKRHNLLVENGWRVFEIPIKYTTEEGFLDRLLLQIYDTKCHPNFEYKKYLIPKRFCKCGKPIHKINQTCMKCRNKKNWCPLNRNELHWQLWHYTKSEIAKKYNVSRDVIYGWINIFKLDCQIPKNQYHKRLNSGFIVDYQI